MNMNQQTNNGTNGTNGQEGAGALVNHQGLNGLNAGDARSQALARLRNAILSARSEADIKEATQKCLKEVGVQHSSIVNIVAESARHAWASNGRPVSPPQLQLQQVPPAASPPDFGLLCPQGLKFQLLVYHFLLDLFSQIGFQLCRIRRSSPHSWGQQPPGARCGLHPNKACRPPSTPGF